MIFLYSFLAQSKSVVRRRNLEVSALKLPREACFCSHGRTVGHTGRQRHSNKTTSSNYENGFISQKGTYEICERQHERGRVLLVHREYAFKRVSGLMLRRPDTQWMIAEFNDLFCIACLIAPGSYPNFSNARCKPVPFSVAFCTSDRKRKK